MIISEEFSDWDNSNRRIDLLAVDKDANLIVIGLKRTDDGGHMELKAIRYASMISNMTWEQAITRFNDFIKKDNLNIDAKSMLCDFFDWESPKEDHFNQRVKIILVSEGFSKEISTAVLWLNEHDLDIRCVRLSLFKLDETLLMNAEQIIPLLETTHYQTGVKEKKQAERIEKNQRDYISVSLSYSGKTYGKKFQKADIGHRTVQLLKEKKLIDDKVFEFLRKDKSCSYQLLKLSEEITGGEKNTTDTGAITPPSLLTKNKITTLLGTGEKTTFINLLKK